MLPILFAIVVGLEISRASEEERKGLENFYLAVIMTCLAVTLIIGTWTTVSYYRENPGALACDIKHPIGTTFQEKVACRLEYGSGYTKEQAKTAAAHAVLGILGQR